MSVLFHLMYEFSCWFRIPNSYVCLLCDIPEQRDRKIAHIISGCMFKHIMSQKSSIKILRQLNNLFSEGLFSTLLAHLETTLGIHITVGEFPGDDATIMTLVL